METLMNTRWVLIIGVIIFGIIALGLIISAGSEDASARIDNSGTSVTAEAQTATVIASVEPRENAVDNEQEESTSITKPDEMVASDSPVVQSTGEMDEVGSGGLENMPAVDLVTPPELVGEEPPNGARNSFSTDFDNHTVSYLDILSGGPPKDGIPAIDRPKFISVEEADGWLKTKEPVIFFQFGEDGRAYPLQILTWHEIVNDVVGGEPVTLTFCPLCNTAIAFKRTIDGQILDFGTTGRLRNSNLIMYDRQTESWWQQATGEGIAGKYAGEQLTFLPAAIVSWEDFRENHPQGRVLSSDTGFSRSYGRNPYAGYDDINSSPFLFSGNTPDQLRPMTRVLTVDLNGGAVAYSYDLLSELHVVNDEIAGQPVVIFWVAGTASALDSGNLAEGRDVGAANSFSRVLDGRTLTFSFDGERIVDEESGSVWNVFGEAESGELAGAKLEPVVGVNHFWFSWAAFKPETRVYTP
jgi:hypothetical protein